MDAAQHPGAAKIIQILADRLRRHLESRSQIIHQNLPLLASELKNCIVTGSELHFYPGSGIILITFG